MTSILPGRFTAHIEGPFAVFIIGMRVNRWLAVRQWWPVFKAMPPMIEELNRNPELGLLGSHSYWMGRTTLLIQYWRSFDHLERYARNPHNEHLPAWRHFNHVVARSGVVGIFHETFLVEAGQYEAVYGNMPVYGLARATDHVPATGQRETARRRLGGESEPGVPTTM